jgi:hypothetical protein
VNKSVAQPKSKSIMQPIQILSPFGNRTRFILTASILGALSLASCERKPGTGDPTLAPNPNQAAGPSELPAGPVSEAPVAATKTLETVRLADAIDAFEKEPTVANHSSVKLAFAKLDGEIAELEDRVVKTSGSERAEAATKLDNLQKYRDAQLIRFPKSQDETALDGKPPVFRPAPPQNTVDSRSATQKAEDTATQVGDKLEDGARRVGEKVEDGAEKVGATLKRAANKTGKAIEEATH